MLGVGVFVCCGWLIGCVVFCWCLVDCGAEVVVEVCLVEPVEVGREFGEICFGIVV